MYHPPSNRKQIIRRIAVYSLMSAVTVGLVVVLVFIMLGYQFNRSDGKIEQGGLTQFDSRPVDAKVTIDGVSLGTPTPSKATMTAGSHFVSMKREGYKEWQKSVKVVPGSVLWLNYVRLIPNELKPASVAHFPVISSTAASPDTKWMAIKEDPATPSIRTADISQDDVKLKELGLPADSYTHPSEGRTQAFSVEKWDPGSRYVLVKHTYNDAKVEWMVVDTQNVVLTKNITTLLGIEASKVVFSNSNSQILYAQIGSDVRQIDLGAATLSRPLITNVAEFSLYDTSVIAYTTLRDAAGTRTVGYYKDGAEKPSVLRSYTDDGQPPLHVAISKYFNDMFVAIAYGDTIHIVRGDLPTNNASIVLAPSATTTFTMPGGVQYLSMMTKGRFVMAQTGPSFMMHDIELAKTTSTTLKGTTEVTKELAWLDKYMLWSDRDNMLRLYEFDGANQHDIMPVVSGFTPTLGVDGKYLYAVTKAADNQYHLSRVRLILP